jgi:hypothetical protein
MDQKICADLIGIITNPFRSEMRSLGFDENKISFGKIPALLRCFIILESLLELLKLPQLNSTQQNRVMTLSKHFFTILPPAVPTLHAMDLAQCRAYQKQLELLRGVEALQTTTRSLSNIIALRDSLSSRLQLVDSEDALLKIKNLFHFSDLPSSYSLKTVWNTPSSPLSDQSFYLLYVPPFPCIASDLLTGIQPMTIDGCDDQRGIHLFMNFRRCLPKMRPVPCYESSVVVVFVVEVAVSGEISPGSVLTGPLSLTLLTAPQSAELRKEARRLLIILQPKQRRGETPFLPSLPHPRH